MIEARRLLLLIATAALLLGGCGGGNGKNTTKTPDEAKQTSGGEWEPTLERVSRGVVVLRVTVPREFDTEYSGSYGGTGFVVDKERGLILTNRHLVQPGPVVGQAVFLNQDEVDIEAVYRDPVHDFGIFRYDPAKVKFTDVEEIELAPEGARVGIDIRILGNDAGEKLSILSGILARLDRDAPRYDSLSYNDFNTFYYQAASGTSGGSSGSPVVDIKGRAVALNAGGAFLAESSFYFPLFRVVRALELIQKDEPVTRGTLQTIFRHKPWDELRRLGLPEDKETTIREANPKAIAMLVVDEIVPEGPGDDLLEVGDILVELNGKPIFDFVTLESALDASVGQDVSLKVIRGGETMEVSPTVDDLHAITPSEYLEVGGAILHPLSYQQARNFRMPVEGIYVARPGYMLTGISWGAVLQSIDGEPVKNLDDLWKVLEERKDRDRMKVRYILPFDSEQEYVKVVYLDRRWFPMQRCKEVRGEGDWPCSEAEPVSETWKPEPTSVDLSEETSAEAAQALASSMIMVEYDIPFYAEGIYAANYVGTGLIVDKERGLVVTDRDTVPIMLGDIQLTFGGSLRIPGKVEFVHPVHNFSVVSFDPALIGDTPITAAKLSDEPPKTGEKLWLVGRDRSYNLVTSEATITKVGPLVLPFPDSPAFRDTNVTVAEASGGTDTLGGVLANEDGSVRALWLSYGYDEKGPKFRGFPIDIAKLVLEPLSEGNKPDYRTLGVEFYAINLADAREYGLTEARINALKKANPKRKQALQVNRTWTDFPSENKLQGGDLLITANGEPVTNFSQLERMAQGKTVEFVILRDGEEKTVTVPTTQLDGTGIERLVQWGGMLLHEPHLAVAAQRSADLEGVYIAWSNQGSPASHYGISPVQMIVEVNGKPTPDLDTFLTVVEPFEDGDAVRLKTVDLEGLEKMTTLELDKEFWPTWELKYTDQEGWTRQ